MYNAIYNLEANQNVNSHVSLEHRLDEFILVGTREFQSRSDIGSMLKCYIRCEWFVRNEDAWTLRTWIFNYTLKWTRVVNDVRFTRKILYTRCDRFNGWSYQLPTYSTGAIRKNSFSLSLSLSFYSKFPIIFLSIPLAILFRSCINLRIARIFVQFFSYIYIYFCIFLDA